MTSIKLKTFILSMVIALLLVSTALADGSSPLVSKLSAETRLQIAQALSGFVPVLQGEIQTNLREQAILSGYRTDLASFVSRLNEIKAMPMGTDEQRSQVSVALSEIQTKTSGIQTGIAAIEEKRAQRSALLQQMLKLLGDLQTILSTQVTS